MSEEDPYSKLRVSDFPSQSDIGFPTLPPLPSSTVDPLFENMMSGPSNDMMMNDQIRTSGPFSMMSDQLHCLSPRSKNSVSGEWGMIKNANNMNNNNMNNNNDQMSVVDSLNDSQNPLRFRSNDNFRQSNDGLGMMRMSTEEMKLSLDSINSSLDSFSISKDNMFDFSNSTTTGITLSDSMQQRMAHMSRKNVLSSLNDSININQSVDGYNTLRDSVGRSLNSSMSPRALTAVRNIDRNNNKSESKGSSRARFQQISSSQGMMYPPPSYSSNNNNSSSTAYYTQPNMSSFAPPPMTTTDSPPDSPTMRAPKAQCPSLLVNRGSALENLDDKMIEKVRKRRRRRRVSRTGGVVCNCKKSSCLKLYCECYAGQGYCNTDCKCVDCKNLPQFEELRVKATKSTLKRNSKAFVPERIVHKGCRCKKSECLKNYCECFQMNLQCAITCKCIGCKNGTARSHITEEETI